MEYKNKIPMKENKSNNKNESETFLAYDEELV